MAMPALGFSLAREGRWLMDFAGYLEQAGSAHVTTELAVTWPPAPGPTWTPGPLG